MIYLFIIFCLLQLADIATTFYIVDRQGGRELNPLMDWLFNHIGTLPALVIVKAALLILIYVTLNILPVWLMIVLCVVYGGVVIHNLLNLNR